jgi:hypothetical protein
MKLPALECSILEHIAYLPNWNVTESGNEITYTYDNIIPINGNSPDMPIGVSFTVMRGEKNA